MARCPSDEDLARLLEEQLDTPSLDGIVAHMEACPACRQRLEELTCGRPLQVGGRPVAEVAAAPASATADRWATDPYATADPAPADPHAIVLHNSAPCPAELAGVPAPGDYEILSKLGEGGMGVVYKARQRPPLDRLVALKMILPQGRDVPERLARFLIEAEAVARLNHPNIVQIYDYGEVGGVPFCSLELLEADSLRDRLAATPQPGKAAAELLVTLARAMHTAHRAGIVHRDLKPANVLFDRDGTPKITDFGLAKRLEREDGQTYSGQVMGTPSYMAPEQARGETRQIGPLADVYALGAILYEMVTGRPPFKGPTTYETIRQVIHEEPVPPSRLQPRVSRDLETICLKCLAKEPHRRYAGAADLADDLGRYLAGEPIRARRTPAWERGLKWAHRHPAAATLLATAATVLIGLAGTWAWYADRARTWESLENRRVAALLREADNEILKAQKALLQRDYTNSMAIVEMLLVKIMHEQRLADRVAQAVVLRDQIEQELARTKVIAADRARYEQFLKDTFEAHFRETQITGLDRPANVKATRASARAALGAFASEGHGDSWSPSPLPASLSAEERQSVEEGRFEMLLALAEAESRSLPGEDPRRQADRGLRILDAAAKLRPASSPAFHLRRAACLVQVGDTAGAERERTLAAGLVSAGPFDHFLSGLERYDSNDGPAAMREFKAVLQAQPDHFWAQCLLAICRLNAQQPAEAWTGLNACLQRRPDVPWLYLLRGFASGQMAALDLKQAEALSSRADPLFEEAAAQFEAAEADYRKALERLDVEPDDELRYILHVNRGVLRLQRRRWADAIADLTEAVQLNPTRFFPYDALAQVYQQQDRLDEALAALTEAIEREPNRADLLRKRARLHTQRKEFDPALHDLGESIRLEAPDSPAQAADHTERGRLLHGTGRLEEALAAYDAALKVVPDDAETHRLRVDVLLKLKRYDDVITSCDGYLASGPPSADLHSMRGLARAARNDLPGAIADDTQALALRPGTPQVLVERGWAYLFSAAPKLALRDFDEAIRLDPSLGDAYGGRGNARVHLGQHREAVADALEALRHGEPGARTYYNAARTLAQAAMVAMTNVDRRGFSALDVAGGYLDRAQTLLRQAIEKLPPAERAVFWRDVVQADPALLALRRRPKFPRGPGPLLERSGESARPVSRLVPSPRPGEEDRGEVPPLVR
jgi:tetratricopeptide (TPR) repeat protein/tRNA A-37 threonylcarbamoyl transferase component Bud32